MTQLGGELICSNEVLIASVVWILVFFVFFYVDSALSKDIFFIVTVHWKMDEFSVSYIYEVGCLC